MGKIHVSLYMWFGGVNPRHTMAENESMFWPPRSKMTCGHRRFCQLHLLQHFNRDHCLTRLGAFILGAVDKVTGFGWKLEEQTVATRVSIELRMIKK